ncbi:TetR/AcrR family transcriptional regulator [Rhizorhabdus wittichii]|uniref:TetR/AcrR family transcriptional regulator n=1 Tax=Rhizorhabdus wittichii TaxID=160791 RepID=A0A975D2N5_9SPHN|nr:TetR/AcrR family transcriptional regulator [Rhizorhabdus wittichii]QTH21574.1 TetR/AcrR family transcriptional regulator [Rhizorhabdus wittichii]
MNFPKEKRPTKPIATAGKKATARVGGKSTQRFEAKRDAIISAGSELINREGVKGMTLAGVAERVGLSTTSVTYYFKLKEDLAVACILRGIEQLEQLILGASGDTPPARIASFLTAYFDLAARIANGLEPPFCVFNDIRALSKPNAATLLRAHNRMLAHMRGFFWISSTPPELEQVLNIRTLLLAAALYWTPLWTRQYDTEDYPRICARMIDILLNGIAPDKKATWNPAQLHFRFENEPDQKEQFLIAATQLINEQGYHGASIDKISARLDLTKGSFYHHLDTKDDLVAMCFQRTFGVIAAAQRSAMAQKGNGWMKLTSACAALMQFQFSNAGPLLEFAAFSALPSTMVNTTVQLSGRVPHRFSEMISDGIIDGSVRPVDAYIAAQIITAAIVSAPEFVHTVSVQTADEAIALLLQPIFSGLLKL